MDWGWGSKMSNHCSWIIFCGSTNGLDNCDQCMCFKSRGGKNIIVFQSDPLKVCALICTASCLSSLGCESVVSKYCSIVTGKWRAQCPQLQAVCCCWHRGIHRVMSVATNSSVISFFALPVDGWLSRDSIELDLAARRTLTVLSPIMSGVFFLYSCMHLYVKQMNERDISAYLDQNRSITRTLLPSLHFFFISPITPPWLLKWEFCLTLISCGEVCKKLIRKSKRAGRSSICNIISVLVCKCLRNKQSMGKNLVQRWT